MSVLAFSIVCPTYEGEKKLAALIDCLDSNFENVTNYPEIIFVVDNSSDSSQDLLDKYKKNHPEKKIIVHNNETNLGPAESRNIGVKLSSGAVILFLDDDCRPNPTWYTDFSSAWSRAASDIQGIGGFVIPTEQETFNGKYCAAFSPIKPWPLSPDNISVMEKLKNYYYTPNPVTHGVSYLAGANMSFKKEAFTKVGGFTPSLRIAEDIAICKNLRNNFGDNCLTVIDSLSIPHEFTESFMNTVRRSYRYGLGSGKNYWTGNGAFSLNPGPVLVVGSIVLSFVFSSITTSSTSESLVYSSVFLLFELLFYALLVTRDNSMKLLSFVQRFTLGFAFLICEFANNIGFISDIRFLFSSRRK